MPVIFPEHVTHSTVKIDDCVADSAGFFAIKNGITILDEGSESLKLSPNKERDEQLIVATLMNMGIYAFVVYNHEK